MPNEAGPAQPLPEPLDPVLLRSGILSRFTPGWIGRPLEVHREIGSTSDRVREILDSLGPAAHGAVVVAESQSSGRR